MIGRRISHFEITAKLGEGGMGEVYRARDARLGREVAIKLLPDAVAADPEHRVRFEREARVLAALNHPNIVTIHEVGTVEEGPFLVMELVEGTPLRDLIPAGGLPLDRCLDIGARVAEALSAAHDKGVTHRDLKPGNVMLTGEGRVKVLDLGLAKLLPGEGAVAEEMTLAPSEPVTREGGIVGTVAYMSPEQAEGRPVDWRTDIFSLGIVLYEMATGSRPFEGDTNMSVLTSIIRDTPRPLTELRPDLPPQLARLIRRCLAKEPRERFQTALDVRNELRLLRQESDTSAAARPPTAAGAGPERRPLWIAAAAVAAALLLGLLLTLAGPFGGDRPPPPERVAAADASAIVVAPFTHRGSPELEYLGEGIVDLLSTKLDGAAGLRSVDPSAVLSYAAQSFDGPLGPAEARQVADRFDAGLYVVGEIVEVGGRLHVSASLYGGDSNGAASRASVEGSAEELFDLVDRLVAELMAERVTGPGSQLTRIAAVTTDSLPALKSYLHAENELRAGRFTAALTAFQETVEIDPDFALAWYRLSVAAEWAVQNELVEGAAARAVELSDRLTDRYRRLLDARLAARRGDWEEAERMYRRILASYPEEVEAWVQLAEVLSHYNFASGRSMTESEEAWRRVLELEPDYAAALWHLARNAAVKGDRQEVESLADRIRVLNPDAERGLEMEALRAFVLDDRDLQQSVLERLSDADADVVALAAWTLVMSTDAVVPAIRIAELMTEPKRPPEVRSLGHAILAYLEVARGRWAEARRQLEAAGAAIPHMRLEHYGLLASLEPLPMSRPDLERLTDEIEAWDAAAVPPAMDRSNFFSQNDRFHPQIRHYLLGLLKARLGDPLALDHAEALDSEPSAFPDVADNLAIGVRAAWWRRQGEPERALAELGRIDSQAAAYQDVFASPFFSHARERFERARLLLSAGRDDEALRWLRSFDEISYYDEIYMPLARLLEAELLEERGEAEAAAAGYELFLELWKDPDPGLAEWRERAEAGLERLRGGA